MFPSFLISAIFIAMAFSWAPSTTFPQARCSKYAAAVHRSRTQQRERPCISGARLLHTHYLHCWLMQKVWPTTPPASFPQAYYLASFRCSVFAQLINATVHLKQQQNAQ